MKNRPLQCAVALAVLLVSGGFGVDLHAEEYDWDEPGQTEMDLLLAVMRNGNTVLMEEFLDGGLAVDSLMTLKGDRVPLLSLAMSTGRIELGKFLIVRGADVNQMSTATVTRVETAVKTVTLRRT